MTTEIQITDIQSIVETIELLDVLKLNKDIIQPTVDIIQKPVDIIQNPVDIIQNPVDIIQNPVDIIQKPVDIIQKPVDIIQKPNNNNQSTVLFNNTVETYTIHKNVLDSIDNKNHQFEKIILPTEETIVSFMKNIETDPINIAVNDIEMFEQSLGIINLTELIPETFPHANQFIGYIFTCLCQNIKLLQSKPMYAVFIKYLFHQYIVEKGYIGLINIYNKIFNDKLYDDINNTAVFYPVLTQEWIYEKNKEYQEKCKQIELRKIAKRIPPSYEVNEIIGAKDKEGKWWMSKVLAVYEHEGHAAYYIEFLGWDDKFNEFIVDGFRLEKYNPRKHRYFRPAWRKN